MAVRKTGSFAGPIDTQINEIIKSIRELEERVMDIKNSFEPQAEETAFDLERHVFNRDNPHLVTAAQLKALPLDFVLDPSSIYMPFHNTLKSTKGLKPSGLYGATRTDYGLIYNPDGSLCATLLPEGGVAVAEGTTNLYKDASEFPGAITDSSGTLTVEEYFERYNGNKVMRLIKTEGEPDSYTSFGRGISIDPDSFYTLHCKAKMVYGGDIQDRFGCRWRGGGTNWEQIIPLGNGWFHCIHTFPPAGADSSNMGFRVKGNSAMEVLVTEPQLEPMPYDTPFVDGNRLPGVLSYDTNGILSPTEGTFSIVINPYEYVYSETYYIDCMDIRKRSTGENNRFFILRKGANSNVPNQMHIRSGSSYTSVNIAISPYTKTRLTWTWKNGESYRMYVNGDCVKTGAYTTTDRDFDTIKFREMGILNEFLIKPYAVSPETVATWHSLDAPFIDPHAALSQDIPYFNTVDEFKNSTANFAMVNVEGTVKIYARTPEGLIIIETLGNTEVI